MNIFMTGATTLQTNKQIREPIQKMNVPRSIVKTLEETMGHHVVWSDFPVGESFPEGTELVWVNIAPPTSINSRYAMSATWALAQAVIHNLPLVVFFDDWQFKNVFGGYKTMARIGERQFTKTLSGKYLYFGDVAKMVEHSEELMAAADLFCSVETPLKLDDVAMCAIPKFTNWGDPEIVSRQMPGTPKLLGIDPTPYLQEIVDLGRHTEGAKERRWLLSSLMPHDKWVDKQGLDWPVDYIGSRKLKAPRLKTEQDVFDRYTNYWGILSPEYPQAGAGWFRTRYIYAAAANSIIYCGKKEGEMFGPSHQLDASLIESPDDARLERMANAQQDTILNGMVFDEFATAMQIEHVLTAAILQKKGI